MRNVFYDLQSFDDGFRNEAIFDSFFGGVHLPVNEWTDLFTRIQKNLTDMQKTYLECDFTTTYTCLWRSECKFYKEDWKSFHLNFVEDRGYEIKPAQYLVDTQIDSKNVCKVSIYGNRQNASEYILGDVFMQSLYVMLDYENSMFAVNGPYITVESTPDKPDRVGGNNLIWIIIGSVVGVLVLVAIIGFIIVRSKR